MPPVTSPRAPTGGRMRLGAGAAAEEALPPLRVFARQTSYAACFGGGGGWKLQDCGQERWSASFVSFFMAVNDKHSNTDTANDSRKHFPLMILCKFHGKSMVWAVTSPNHEFIIEILTYPGKWKNSTVHTRMLLGPTMSTLPCLGGGGVLIAA